MTSAIVLVTILAAVPATEGDPVTFNRDVRPILAEHCWQCHGPDEQVRQSGLRLDILEQALQPADSGSTAVVPNAPQRSELVRRITAGDDDIRMPPAEFNKPLSSKQIATLTHWIAQGAEYERHWAFQPLTRPTLPPTAGASNPIDAFVVAKLRQHGREFAPQAKPETLLRRVSFALTGLPPSRDDIDQFQRRSRHAPHSAYPVLIDRLLASPHFGERMAVGWLDAARYADTNGYFGDKPRQMWLWRDWVIEAFNANMRYDQFTIEQLAGDLLPLATIQQRIATGFNRNHMANNESGIIDEEYRTEYVVDRVDTTMTTWLGLTAGCSQCHDHKFDPISQREFYQLFALFNNVPEKGWITSDNPPPVISVKMPGQDRRLAELTAASAEAQSAFENLRLQLDAQIAAWETDVKASLSEPPVKDVVLYEAFDGHLASGTRPVGTELKFKPGLLGQAGVFDATQHAEVAQCELDADAPWSIGFWAHPDGNLSCLLSKIEPQGKRRGLEVLLQKGRVAVNLVEQWGVQAIEVATRDRMTVKQWHHVVIGYDGSRSADGLRVRIDGARVELVIRRDSLTGSMVNAEVLRIGRRDSGLGYYGSLDELRIIQASLSDEQIAGWFRGERVRGILATDSESRSDTEREFLLDDFIRQSGGPDIRDARRRAQRTQQAEAGFRSAIPTALVMEELAEPRTTRILVRGQYDQPGDEVQPGVPGAIASLEEDAPRNRLGFARWLVSKDNPLTARVAANRLWQRCFGEGLVRTMNDFGTQGEPPTHPELLDWLAATLRDNGWDLKSLLRLIVTSRTYRQDSSFGGDALWDPDNSLLARGPSFRMSAEMIRDQALASSGLLCRKIGGPSVKPYQPPGLWEEVSYNAQDSYEPDTGVGLWRRSVYTYIKRQSPPPALLAFDGTSREKCTVQRSRTNTPLQALVLLNDPTFIEAARVLAAELLAVEVGDSERLEQLFLHVLSRAPEGDEIQTLAAQLNRLRQRFRASPRAAQELVAVGESATGRQLDRIELACWTVIAQTVLNLDEAITLR